MNFFVQILEAVALLVPDFLVLGLVAPTSLSLYCIAKARGLTRTTDVDSGLVIALSLAYFVTIAVNVASHLLTPVCPAITTTPRSKSQSAPKACEISTGKQSPQSVEQKNMFTAL